LQSFACNGMQGRDRTDPEANTTSRRDVVHYHESIFGLSR
jgi:hypothetical protein